MNLVSAKGLSPARPDYEAMAVALEPRLGRAWVSLLDKAPREEVEIAEIYARDGGSGHLVVASRKQREENQLLEQYPLHFKKVYESGFRDKATVAFEIEGATITPKDELLRSIQARKVLKDLAPMPLACDEYAIRTEYIPGRSLREGSPFAHRAQTDPNGMVKMAKMLDPFYASKAWGALESLYAGVQRLHNAGFTHRDMHAGNILTMERDGILSPRIIDFEAMASLDAIRQSGALTEMEILSRTKDDFKPILREAALIQAAWGPQNTDLGKAARVAAQKLVPMLDPIPEPNLEKEVVRTMPAVLFPSKKRKL